LTSATDKTYATLLEQIQRGALPAGSFLVESDLAGALGVSRTPVREAIRRLAAEGLVLAEGRRRAQVRDFDATEVEELFEIRARLESYAAERAATRLTATQLARLRELDAQMQALVQITDPSGIARFADLNDAFHQLILEAAAARHLEAALRPVLQIQLLLLQRYRETIAEHLERSAWHHRELIRAFELRDPALAAAQMRLHMLSARGARSAAADPNTRSENPVTPTPGGDT
jgi:DNA-binding GntR family transcriptional regulator